MTDDVLTHRIIAGVIRVHQVLGPGFREHVYRRALTIELRKQELAAEIEPVFAILYDGRWVGRHRLDLLVERRVIVELKTVDDLSKAHYAQVRSYLKATGLKTALLVNFAGAQADFRRVGHPDPMRRSVIRDP
jgi:GxxExxY protein